MKYQQTQLPRHRSPGQPPHKRQSRYFFSYKIRITEFLKDLLDPENDDPATKLGLVITQNVLSTSTGAIEGRTDTDTPNRVPYASIIANRGTILYGSNVNVPEAKRLKLKVFYTEASN